MTDADTEPDGHPLPEPIKLRWDGNARDRFRSFLVDRDSERATAAETTLTRLQTKVVCETLDETEAFHAELSEFLTAAHHGQFDWVDCGQVAALGRVRDDVRTALGRYYREHSPPRMEARSHVDTDADADTQWRVRCPDCDWSRTYDTRMAAVELQLTGCADCNRGLGVAPVQPTSDDETAAEDADALGSEIEGDAPEVTA
jgi:hypothetical protein